MNTTNESSKLSSSKTTMAPTTTVSKSTKKGLVVLAALCMTFFYTGRLSSNGSDGAQFDASLLRGWPRDVDVDPDSCDGQYFFSNYFLIDDTVGTYDCQLTYFDSAESLAAWCGQGFGVTCDSSKKCPELGFTKLMERQSFPPGNPFGWTCAVSYISPKKPVPPCCETGSWLSCNYDRCESETTKDYFCPGLTGKSYCNGFEDCFDEVCDCDEAKNDVCNWAH